jgi:hypothetical protein
MTPNFIRTIRPATLLIVAGFISQAALAAPVGAAPRLTSLADVMQTLKQGGSVRAVFDYKQCKLMSLKEFTASPKDESETSDPSCQVTIQNKPSSCYYASPEQLDAIGGLQFSTWEYFGAGFIGPKAYVTSSDAKLISIRGFVTNYGSIKIFDDNSVVVKVNYLRTAQAIPTNAATQPDTPISARRGPNGDAVIVSKKLIPQEQIITMDEMFACAISNGSDANGASFFATP